MGPREVSTARRTACRDGSPPVVGPQSIGIALTNACNLNCVTCWSYSSLRKELPQVGWRRQRLDRELLRGVFSDARSLQTERVIFTGGGDPLAHPEFYDIVSDAKAHGLKVTMISNLTLARDRDRLVSLGIDTVLANFSSGDPESYAAFHPNRSPDDFDVLLKTLHAIRAGGAALKLVFVVCAINAHVLEEAVRIAGDLGASVQWKRVSVTPDTASLDLSPPIRARLLADLPRLQACAGGLNVSANWEVFDAELRGETLAGETVTETGCHAGHYYGRIGANGDVRFCCNSNPELRVGSLHDARFAALWQSVAYERLRGKLRDGGFVSGCDQCGKLDLNRRVWRELQTLL
ncbi:MAG: radical SAM protein [Akkermansiaceae bacterium]|nr:radical SAM protein [Armatimonadota bacterium]